MISAETFVDMENIKPGIVSPSYTTEVYTLKREKGCAGWDLCSIEDRTVLPGDFGVRIKTGIRVAFPEGFYGRIAEKSSIALKGIIVGAGVVDSTYRGELMVIMHNVSNAPFEIKKGMKIAQIIGECHTKDFQLMKELPDTERGDKGFGSTGAMHSSLSNSSQHENSKDDPIA